MSESQEHSLQSPLVDPLTGSFASSVTFLRKPPPLLPTSKLWMQMVKSELEFVFGKAILAPQPGVTIPRLEICTAVLAVEIADMLAEEMDVHFQSVQFFTDKSYLATYATNPEGSMLCEQSCSENQRVILTRTTELRSHRHEPSRPCFKVNPCKHLDVQVASEFEVVFHQQILKATKETNSLYLLITI